MRSFDLGPGRITAALGPTNTGKTHRALQRMLAHPSGMIGLPLRLLAQEVYERLDRERPGQVALITGEQQITPPGARYTVCTMEALPVDKAVHFVAIDEAQLAGSPNRGHAFTQRLLHARGVSETWILGSDTLAPLVETLIPTAELAPAQRLSTLRYTGPRKLLSLPKRSAIVAFSTEQVYELAEALRRKHGGAAVVLGSLSPRARNAQVALYNSGEVDYIVATDAIGMGLNLDIDHVAFAGLRKFDGRGMRDLRPDELAQIAGRAGRYTTDGSFGTLNQVGPLDPEIVHAIEQHRFPALRRLYWRNHELDFSSLSSLVDSLNREAPRRELKAVHDWPDQLALQSFSQDPHLRTRIQSPQAVALAWEVARIPDFRKTLTGSHEQLLVQILGMLLERGELPEDFLDGRLGRLDRSDGDIDALMARMAWVRTWNYVSFRSAWLRDPAHWQARCRALEDRLSDALHKALTRRFTDKRRVVLMEEGKLDPSATDERVLPHEIKGALRGLRYIPRPSRGHRSIDAELQSAIRAELDRRVARLSADEDPAFSLDTQAALSWQQTLVARLEPGPTLLTPQAVLLRNPHLGQGAARQLQGALDRWLTLRIHEALGPITFVPRGLSAPARELVDHLQQALGVVSSPMHRSLIQALSPRDRGVLGRARVRLGRHHVYCDHLDDEAACYAKALLSALHSRQLPLAEIPGPGTRVEEATRSRELYRALGFAVVGPLAIRVDLLEELGVALRKRARRSRGPLRLDRALKALVPVHPRLLEEAIEALTAST